MFFCWSWCFYSPIIFYSLSPLNMSRLGCNLLCNLLILLPWNSSLFFFFIFPGLGLGGLGMVAWIQLGVSVFFLLKCWILILWGNFKAAVSMVLQEWVFPACFFQFLSLFSVLFFFFSFFHFSLKMVVYFGNFGSSQIYIIIGCNSF